MKRGIIIVVIVGLLGWAVYDYVANKSETSTDSVNNEVENDDGDVDVGLERGDRAPDFSLTTLDGEEAQLSDYRGEKVLVNFWATWCPPCRAEMPDLQKVHEEKDVVILGINLTETKTETEDVDPFIEEFGITFPILLDEDSEVSTQYQISPIPTNFLIDSQGIIHNVAYGAVNYDLLVQEFDKMD